MARILARLGPVGAALKEIGGSIKREPQVGTQRVIELFDSGPVVKIVIRSDEGNGAETTSCVWPSVLKLYGTQGNPAVVAAEVGSKSAGTRSSSSSNYNCCDCFELYFHRASYSVEPFFIYHSVNFLRAEPEENYGLVRSHHLDFLSHDDPFC